VLSGQPISRGTAIYRPTKTDPMPTNADAMVLATVMEDALSD
jgi:hypothetical protein